eukprot:TRINITY_DN2495_c0_g1_i9.p2 TRINITY_DN2495_c0_g1~~TRINITY_DN2495_c0_g1_i9.p2  ORF type:complete len:160 (-),score=33.63 TRINITY_DN2495_c0_g1_i9:269-748(-)
MCRVSSSTSPSAVPVPMCAASPPATLPASMRRPAKISPTARVFRSSTVSVSATPTTQLRPLPACLTVTSISSLLFCFPPSLSAVELCLCWRCGVCVCGGKGRVALITQRQHTELEGTTTQCQQCQGQGCLGCGVCGGRAAKQRVSLHVLCSVLARVAES